MLCLTECTLGVSLRQVPGLCLQQCGWNSLGQSLRQHRRSWYYCVWWKKRRRKQDAVSLISASIDLWLHNKLRSHTYNTTKGNTECDTNASRYPDNATHSLSSLIQKSVYRSLYTEAHSTKPDSNFGVVDHNGVIAYTGSCGSLSAKIATWLLCNKLPGWKKYVWMQVVRNTHFYSTEQLPRMGKSNSITCPVGEVPIRSGSIE